MRILLVWVSLIMSVAACGASENAPGNFKEGVHYTVLDKPVRTADPSKIEVTEVFWYGCGHCYHFESLVAPWAKKQGDDVNFVASPAMWPVRRPGVPQNWMEIHARAFYTAKALGMLEELHIPLFQAINVERKLLKDADEIAELFMTKGVDKAKFMKTFNSFGVVSQVKQADARAKGYRISGTPELVVQGKYRITTRMVGSQEKMLEVADFLIKKLRAEKKS